MAARLFLVSLLLLGMMSAVEPGGAGALAGAIEGKERIAFVSRGGARRSLAFRVDREQLTDQSLSLLRA